MTAALILAAALALLYWGRFCYRGQSTAKSVVKTASILLLLAVAWAMAAPFGLLVALALCALGDYLLSRDSEVQFMAGVGAFAAGHIAYVVLCLTTPGADPSRILSHPILILVLTVFGVVMARLLWPRAGNLRGPVMGYIPIILSMGLAVQALPDTGALSLATVAAALFILSDMTLSLEMFVLHPTSRSARIAPFIVWPTYWLAQLTFVAAFTGLFTTL